MSYIIMVRERGASKEIELCRVERNPEQVMEAARQKTLLVHRDVFGDRRTRVPKYDHVWVVEVKP